MKSQQSTFSSKLYKFVVRRGSFLSKFTMIRNIETRFDLDAENCICLRIHQTGTWYSKIFNTGIFLLIILAGVTAWKFSLLEYYGISVTTFIGVLSLIGFIICRQVCISFVILNFGGCTIHGLCQNSEMASHAYAIEMEDCQLNRSCRRVEGVEFHDGFRNQRLEEVEIHQKNDDRFEEIIEETNSSGKQMYILPNGKEVKAVIHEQGHILDKNQDVFEHDNEKRNPNKSVSLKERRKLVLEALLLPNKQRQEYSYEFLEPVEPLNNDYSDTQQQSNQILVMEQQNLSKQSSAMQHRTEDSKQTFKYYKNSDGIYENSYNLYENVDTMAEYEKEHHQGKMKRFGKVINDLFVSPIKLRERKRSTLQAALKEPPQEVEIENDIDGSNYLVEEVFDEYQNPVNIKERRTTSKESIMSKHQNPTVVVEEVFTQDSVNLKERKTTSEEATVLKSYENLDQSHESDLEMISREIEFLAEEPEGIVFETEQEEDISQSLCSWIISSISILAMVVIEILPSLMLVALSIYFDFNLTSMLRVKVLCLLILSFNVFLTITRNRSQISLDKNQEKVTVKLHAVLTKE